MEETISTPICFITNLVGRIDTVLCQCPYTYFTPKFESSNLFQN